MNKQGATGFIEHHDTHEVFAIQVHGSKRWSVGPPIVEHASLRYKWFDEHVSEPEDLATFEAGAMQLMYIPLGWRHKAEPTSSSPSSSSCASEGDTSVHITMGIQTPRWADLLEALAHASGAHSPPLRQCLPFTVGKGGLDYTTSSSLITSMLQHLQTNSTTALSIPGGAQVTVTCDGGEGAAVADTADTAASDKKPEAKSEATCEPSTTTKKKKKKKKKKKNNM